MYETKKSLILAIFYFFECNLLKIRYLYGIVNLVRIFDNRGGFIVDMAEFRQLVLEKTADSSGNTIEQENISSEILNAFMNLSVKDEEERQEAICLLGVHYKKMNLAITFLLL